MPVAGVPEKNRYQWYQIMLARKFSAEELSSTPENMPLFFPPSHKAVEDKEGHKIYTGVDVSALLSGTARLFYG